MVKGGNYLSLITQHVKSLDMITYGVFHLSRPNVPSTKGSSNQKVNVVDNLPEPFLYQVYGAGQLVKNMHSGLLSKPGIGKTRTIIMALQDSGVVLEDDHPEGSILIVCSGPAQATWRRELPKWLSWVVADEDVHIVTGKPTVRRVMWAQARQGYGFYICNYSIFLRDQEHIREVGWGAMIADEYHKSMRGRKTATFKTFRSICKHVKFVVLASGSPWRKNPGSLWTLFNICEPGLFGSYWRWVTMTCHQIDTGFGLEIIGPKNVENLHKLMNRYLAYIPAEVSAEQLPGGLRSSFPVEMTPEQEKVYDELNEDMMSSINDRLVVTPTVLVKLLRLRQLLCCPKIIDESLGMGGGFDAILDTLEEESHVVIFVPFRNACDHVRTALQKAGYEHAYILRGGIGADEQDRVIQEFKKYRGIIVCTIAYAESYDLETCATSFFLGYEFVLDMQEQAEGRTQRAISKHEFVTWRYVKYAGTVDDNFLQMLDLEKAGSKLVFQRPEEWVKRLRGEQ